MTCRPELLAPAGSWEALVAAVENGADAVYLGGRQFNARLRAGNFDHSELVRAIEYAHMRGVKVYVTVNTLLADRELPEAALFLHFIHNAGADAAIIQDLGLARLARNVLPELALHASTQMTVHNLPAAELLREAGFRRIILARELSLDAITAIVKRSGIEVEVFGHGALCLCYSGQCLFSSMVGGRSGNRGLCAQPCRLRYELTDEKGRVAVNPGVAGDYLLSTRDLNLSNCLPELIKSGIVSLKIEGRMKRPEYVATVVRIYRRLIDRAVNGGNYRVEPEEARELAQVFNRGFTTGYLFGRFKGELMNCSQPNNRGIKLGRVKSYDRERRQAEIILEEPLQTGDGIEIWVTEGGRVACKVGRMFQDGGAVERASAGTTALLPVKGRVRPGDRVFKIFDICLFRRARATFTSPQKRRKIPLLFFVKGRLNMPLSIVAKDPDGLVGEAGTSSLCQPAFNRPLTGEFLQQQLGRLGNTPFTLGCLQCDMEGAVMVPVREINAARRQALAQLAEKRLQAAKTRPVAAEVFQQRLLFALKPCCRKVNSGEILPGSGMLSPALAVAVADLSSLKAAVCSGADVVYYGGEQFRFKLPLDLEQVDSGSSYCAENGVRFIFSTPRILHDFELAQYCRLLEKIVTFPVGGVLGGNLGLLRRVEEITGLPIYADFPLNVFNYEAAAFLAERRVKQITLSPELTLTQISEMVPHLAVPAEVLVHGALPLMVSECCLIGGAPGDPEAKGGCAVPCNRRYGLKDRLGITFPVATDRSCRTHIFNSRVLCMIEDVDQLAAAGVAVLRVEAGREEPAYVSAVVEAYRRVIDCLTAGGDVRRQSLLARKAIAGLDPAGFTKGHYFRGVL